MHAFWEIVISNVLVVAVLAVVVGLLGRIWKNPAGLHVLWVLVLLKLVTPPLVALPIPLLATDAQLGVKEVERRPGDSSWLYVEASSDNNSANRDEPAVRVLQRPRTSPDIAVTLSTAQPQGIPWLTVLAWTWGTGTVLLAIHRVCGIHRFLRLLRAAEPPTSAVLGVAEDISNRLRLKQVPEIQLLPVRLSPLVWFLGGRPRVFLPAALFERLDAEGQQAILAHELGHVWRKDHWVRLVELLVSTIYWWHPVVWWARRQLRELEEQCCDGLVLGTLPHGARAYATALMDTLDFLSEPSLAVPLVTTSAQSTLSMARRIRMLKNPAPVSRLAVGRLVLLAAVATLPMTLAFAAKPLQTDGPSHQDNQESTELPAVERRAINKLVTNFPEKTDLSTPESALAAWNRASARGDDDAVLELSWVKWGPHEIQKMKKHREDNPAETTVFNDALLNAELLEVLTYREDLADVISKLKFPEDVGRVPYSSRSFGRIHGVWKNLGEDRLPSLEAARLDVDRKKENVWQQYVKLRDAVEKGQSVPLRSESTDRSARIAPDEPMGISSEKADLMGRIEWAMMYGGQDITARKSLEWSDIQRDENGNRTIRYKYYATIWDKDIYIMNQVFTFDTAGNILNMKNVEGFPQKKVEKPVDDRSQEGMKELIEDFFSRNYRDITSRESLEWGEVAKTEDGNSSIGYKYRATIRDTDTEIMHQTFTFDAKGKFVSVRDEDRIPQGQ